MQIGAVEFQPYVYNANQVSSASLNKISAISDDVVSQKLDYSDLAGETTNPLHKGESSNFMDIIAMQMQISSNKAAHIMKSDETAIAAESMPTDSVAVEEMDAGSMANDTLEMQDAEAMDVMEETEAMDELVMPGTAQETDETVAFPTIEDMPQMILEPETEKEEPQVTAAAEETTQPTVADKSQEANKMPTVEDTAQMILEPENLQQEEPIQLNNYQMNRALEAYQANMIA